MRPKTIAMFVVSCMLLLAGVCAFFPVDGIQIGATELKMTSLTDIIGGNTQRDVTEEEEEEATTLTATTLTIGEPIVTPDTTISDTIADTHIPSEYNYLTAFYQSLCQTDSSQVRVVHYGDSQLEGDRMTKELRQALQVRFGGGGVGLIPLHQTIPSQCISQTLEINGEPQSANSGPQRYMAYGPKRFRRDKNLYGPMAQVAVLNDTILPGSEDVTLHLSTYKKGLESYFNQIRIFGTRDSLIRVKDSTSRYNLRLKYEGDIYGISLETRTGVIVDNIPMRGCAGTIFTSIHAKELRHFFSTTNTRLIILQFGGNVMPYAKDAEAIHKYAERLRRQIRYIQSCAPQASILFIGPSDMLHKVNGELVSYPLLPTMDTILHQMVNEENAAYWSLYEAMGGEGAMKHWIQMGWAGNDGVHFTRKGANRAGDLLTEWLMTPIKQ